MSSYADTTTFIREELERILIIDLEATCSEDSSFTVESMETIEVGAVWANYSGVIIDQFQSFVRPLEHSYLTSFCTALTGITQRDVESAPTWPLVAQELHKFITLHKTPVSCWGSWGNFDFNQIQRDCLRHNVSNPLNELDHHNLKALFAKTKKIKQVGMSAALKIAGISLDGPKHRAIYDALNIAKLVPWTISRRIKS